MLVMYHYSSDVTVPKSAPSYHKNAEGPFYVSDQCIICALPIETAPENFCMGLPGWLRGLSKLLLRQTAAGKR